MPNIKSAKKRVLVNRTKAQRNKSRNSALKTAIKKANAAIDANVFGFFLAIGGKCRKICGKSSN